MHIYVASSWRNTYYPEVVQALQDAGHKVYDFRNPPTGDPRFHWTDIDSNCINWTPFEYQTKLSHPLAERQFKNDIDAMTALTHVYLFCHVAGLRTQKQVGSQEKAKRCILLFLTKIVLSLN